MLLVAAEPHAGAPDIRMVRTSDLNKQVLNFLLSVRDLKMEYSDTERCIVLFPIVLICAFHVNLLSRCMPKYFASAYHGISSSNSFSPFLGTCFLLKVEYEGTGMDIGMKTADIANLSEPMGMRRVAKTFLGRFKLQF
jgi:hypothetical protein